MTEDQVLKHFEDATKIKGIDKDLKKELKETKERVGDNFSFLKNFDIERILQVPENDKFNPKDVATFIIESKLHNDPDTVDLEELNSIATRPEDSMDGPGLKDKDLAEKTYKMLLDHPNVHGFNIGKLIITTGKYDLWGNKELARNAAEIALSNIEDPDALEFIQEIVEDESFLGDANLAKKIAEKLNSLK